MHHRDDECLLLTGCVSRIERIFGQIGRLPPTHRYKPEAMYHILLYVMV